MIQYWKLGIGENAETIAVEVPEFYLNFVEIVFPIVAGYSDESEQSVIYLYDLYKKFVQFVDEARKNRHALSCSELSFEVVGKLNQISNLFLSYLKILGVKRFLPELDQVGYFPLKPTDCIPYCQYAYEAVEDKLFDIREWLLTREMEQVEGTDSEMMWS